MSIVLAAVTVALTLYLPVLTGRAVDLIIEKGVVDFAGILAILKRMAVIILLTAVAQWIMNACNNKITYHIIRDDPDSSPVVEKGKDRQLLLRLRKRQGTVQLRMGIYQKPAGHRHQTVDARHFPFRLHTV